MSYPIILTSDQSGLLDEQTVEHLQELQRFAEIGRLSASLLHEISNPLTAAILHLDPSNVGTSTNIRHARRNIQVLQRYVEAARQQVKQSSAVRLFSVRSQFEQVRQILEPHARRHSVKLQFVHSENVRIYGDPVKFQQIIANLVKNAIDSYATLPADGSHRLVEVSLSISHGHVDITVKDHGLGMTPEELSQVFTPFYTTKVKAGHGLGIGLTIVKQYIEADFNGKISARSQLGSGSTFTISFQLSVLVKDLATAARR